MLHRLLYITFGLLFFQLSTQAQDSSLDSAINYYQYGDFDKSMAFLQKIDANDPTLDNRRRAWTAKILGQNGLYTLAFNLLDSASKTEDITLVEIANARGFLLQSQGYPNEALEALENGYQTLNKYQESKLKTTITIENLSLSAISYWQLGSIDEASDYLKQALLLNKQIDDALGIANCNINLGLVYSTTDTYKAQFYYEQALQEYNSLYPNEDHPNMASIYTNLGIVFEKNFFLDKAITSFEKASSIWEKTYGSDHPNVAFTNINIGDAYLKNNQADLAKEYYEFARASYQEIFGLKHPEIANIFLKLGEISYDQGNTKEALKLYQKALIANSKSFENENINATPQANDYISPFITISALQKKAVALEKRHFTKSLKRKDLMVGIDGLKLAHQIIQKVRTTQKNKADKIRLSAITNDIYSDGIHLCLSMADASVGEGKWVKEAFNFVEWSKAASLLESIQETNAKSFSGIPKELIDKENTLQEKIYSLEQQALKADANSLPKIEEELFSTQSTLNAHIKALESDYPKYYELKYNQESITYKEIQEKISDDEILISYFISEKEELLYIFLISKGKITYFTETFDDNVKDEIISLETGLKFNFDEIIIMSTNYLSPILFPFTLPSKINKITFLLDGQINTIPMDIMLTEEVYDTNLPLKKYPFLINDYAICYNFSATLAFATDEKPIEKTPSIASFAPVVFQDSTGEEVLNSLFGTLSEVREISNMFEQHQWEAKAYTYKNAKKSILKKDSIQNFTYLHFATHGFVDEEHPNQSYIYLMDEEGQEGLLHASEIYNLDLDVELVTLSACETGLGKLSKGEGLIGLSRALKYAGSKNSIVSLWTINDLSTALMMQYLYQEITDEIPISVALQKAKIKLIEEGLYFSPYYWAPFTLIGRH